MRIPEVDGWNLTIQQQLDATTSFSLAYVGNKSTHSIPNSTWGGINWNDYTVVGFAQGLSQCQRSVFFAKWGYLRSRVHRLLRERGECPLQLAAGHV